MKHLLFIMSAGLLFTSCGVNQAFVFNQNQNSTQVHLSEANFRNVGKVMGTDSVDYILLIGGLKKKRMYERAYSSMMNNAELGTGPRAVVNVITEEHAGGVPPLLHQAHPHGERTGDRVHALNEPRARYPC